VFDPGLFKALQAGSYPLLPLLQEAIRTGRASAALYDGTWMDIGTPDRLQQLDRMLKQGEAS
jgi:MurNAc alpha-1-phosphate uridylyltransferase